MSVFTLDTSGFVWLQHGQLANTYWEDLSPFEQGYIEALLIDGGAGRGWSKADRRDWPGKTSRHIVDGSCPPLPADIGFSDLHPEALAAIRKDCEALSCDGLEHCDREDGDHSWKVRQAGRWPDFPPLTAALNNAGKVVFS